MTIQERVSVPDRIRRPPRAGFSRVDRRLLRDFAARLSGNAALLCFLYVFETEHVG